MKLPEKHPALRFMPGGLNDLEKRLAESLVRDCAKVLRKRLDNIYEEHSYTESDTNATIIDRHFEMAVEELEEMEEAILARYGLPPEKQS